MIQFVDSVYFLFLSQTKTRWYTKTSSWSDYTRQQRERETRLTRRKVKRRRM